MKIALVILASTLLASCHSRDKASGDTKADQLETEVRLTETQAALSSAHRSLVSELDEDVVNDISTFQSAGNLIGRTIHDYMMGDLDDSEIVTLSVSKIEAEDSDGDDRLADILRRVYEFTGDEHLPYFCYRFRSKPEEITDCRTQLVELLSPLSHDPKSRVYLVLSHSLYAFDEVKMMHLYVAPEQKDFASDGEVTVLKLSLGVMYEI